MIGQSPIGILPLGPFTEKTPYAIDDALSETSLESPTVTALYAIAIDDALSGTRADFVIVRKQGEGRVFGPAAQSG